MEGVNELVSARTRFTEEVLKRMFLSLFEERADWAEHPPTFAPGLADSYEWSADHRELTVRLRANAVWSDGAPITSEDVRWTWQAQVHPDVAWTYADSKQAVVDVEALDPHTVRFRFARAYAAQLADANEGLILPRHAWGSLPFSEWRHRADWFRDRLVVSGPFTLESWSPQQEIVLARNERYAEGELPYLDRVVFRIVPERTNQVTQLLAGTLDLVHFLPPDEVRRIEGAPGVELVRSWAPQYTYLGWNTRNPLLADAALRRALTMAIDRQSILDAIWRGAARAATSPVASTFWAHNEAIRPWPYAPEEARRLFAEHGWRDRDGDGVLDRDGRPFAFEILTNGDNRPRVDAAVMIQEQLKRVGVGARLRLLELNAANTRAAAGDFDAWISAFTVDTSLDLGYAFHSRSIGGGFNFGAYANPEVDRLIDATREETDPARFEALLGRLQEILHQDQPFTFLWEPQRLTAVRSGLRGVTPDPVSAFADLPRWWLASPQGG